MLIYNKFLLYTVWNAVLLLCVEDKEMLPFTVNLVSREMTTACADSSLLVAVMLHLLISTKQIF